MCIYTEINNADNGKTNMHGHKHTHRHAYTQNTHKHAYTQTYTQTWTQTRTHTHTHTHTNMYAHKYGHRHACTQIWAQACTTIHAGVDLRSLVGALSADLFQSDHVGVPQVPKNRLPARSPVASYSGWCWCYSDRVTVGGGATVTVGGGC